MGVLFFCGILSLSGPRTRGSRGWPKPAPTIPAAPPWPSPGHRSPPWPRWS